MTQAQGGAAFAFCESCWDVLHPAQEVKDTLLREWDALGDSPGALAATGKEQTTVCPGAAICEHGNERWLCVQCASRKLDEMERAPADRIAELEAQVDAMREGAIELLQAQLTEARERIRFLEGRLKEGDQGWKLDLLTEARAVLKLVEWRGNFEFGAECPMCFGRDPAASKLVGVMTGHTPDCRLDKVVNGT